ncbi:MAG: hypothetical protein ACLFS1_07870 [Opitutales bacterium]
MDRLVDAGSDRRHLPPYGHPAPFLVQEPGNYRSTDYIRFGLGLNAIALIVILGVVPLVWPL